MKPFKPLLLFVLAGTVSLFAVGCSTTDEDDDDDHGRRASTTTTTTVEERRVAPGAATHETTRVERY
jgi:hypothetical protein